MRRAATASAIGNSSLATVRQAVTLHRQGRLDEAELLYIRILQAQHDHFDALHLLGVLMHQRGRSAEALELIARALAVNARSADALANQGRVLAALGRLEAARASFDQALALKPDQVDVLLQRGNVLHRLNRSDAALASLERALALQPHHAEALHNRGVILHALRRYEQALASYDGALSLLPGNVTLLNNRGATLGELGRFDEALASYNEAIALQPDYADALYNCGNVLKKLNRHEEAVAYYDRTLALRPNYAQAYYNRGNALQALERYDAALASYDRAIALQRDHAAVGDDRGDALRGLERYEAALADHERALSVPSDDAAALANRGAALRALKRLETALADSDQAPAVQGDLSDAFNNRGITLKELRQFDAALASYAGALAARPGNAEAHWNEALLRLLIGDYARGWAQYEWRWRKVPMIDVRRDFPQPLWLGDDAIAGKTILLHSEQGLGDAIQFCRYVPLVAARGARVVLEVQPPLCGLMASLAGAAQVVARGEPLPDFDLHCPLLSLPLACGTQLASIPSATPYLQAPAASLTDWQRRLSPRRRPLIGLVWAGSAGHKNDHHRSIPLRALAPLIDLPASFISLQKDLRADDAAVLDGRGDILHYGDALNDFSDTAALVAQLDLLISVDTSVAHLAGALGKPAWILLTHIPDFRWLLARDDSPWYPSLRLFRQDETRAWDGVILRLRDALGDFIDGCQ